MRDQDTIVISAINHSPYNMGLDGVSWLALPENRTFVFKNGDVVLFDYQTPHVFDVHFLFDTARGRAAIDQARVAFGHMFSHQNAHVLSGLTPIDNRKARIFNRLIGCKSMGLYETPFGQCEKFVITHQMWKAN